MTIIELEVALRRQRAETAMRELLAGLEVVDLYETGRHGAIPVRHYKARGTDPERSFVWIHGGAFSHGGLDQLESHAVAAAIAHTGTAVVAVDYRRAPRWSWFREPATGQLPGIRFPIPLDDVCDAFVATGERYGGEVALGGASAGACLAAAASVRLVSEGRAPGSLVLAYGTFHAELPEVDPELRARLQGRHRFAQFTPSVVRRMNHNYAGSAANMTEPAAFPGGHTLPVLPRSFLLDADHDSLRASGQAFAGELRRQGTVTEYAIVAESSHGFLDRPGTPPFLDAVDRIGRFLEGRLR